MTNAQTNTERFIPLLDKHLMDLLDKINETYPSNNPVKLGDYASITLLGDELETPNESIYFGAVEAVFPKENNDSGLIYKIKIYVDEEESKTELLSVKVSPTKFYPRKWVELICNYGEEIHLDEFANALDFFNNMRRAGVYLENAVKGENPLATNIKGLICRKLTYPVFVTNWGTDRLTYGPLSLENQDEDKWLDLNLEPVDIHTFLTYIFGKDNVRLVDKSEKGDEKYEATLPSRYTCNVLYNVPDPEDLYNSSGPYSLTISEGENTLLLEFDTSYNNLLSKVFDEMKKILDISNETLLSNKIQALAS